MIVKMATLWLLGSSHDKEEIGVARPEGPPLRWFRPKRRPETSSVQRTRIEETVKKSKSKKSRQRYFSSTGRTNAIGFGASDGCRKNRRQGILVQKGIEAKSAYRHRMNRRFKKRHRCIGRTVIQRRCKSRKS